MQDVKDALYCALLLALLALAAWLTALVQTTRKTVAAMPSIVQSELAATRQQVLAEVDKQAMGIRGDAVGQIQALRAETLKRFDAMTGMVDKRTGEALGMLDSRSGRALSAIDGLRHDVAPVLVNVAALAGNGAALAKDAQDSLDDLYPDIKASTESATVTITSVAHASEAVRDAAPEIAASVVSVGKSADAIAGDVRREVDAATAPKKWWQKILGPVYTIGRLVGVFL